MEIGISLNRNKKKKEEGEEEQTKFDAPLGAAGPLFWTDKHFERRMENNKGLASTFWKEEEIVALKNISEVKKNILRRVNRMFEYMSDNVPHGKPLENPRLSAAVRSINDLLLMAQNLALSETTDEDAVMISNDYFSRCHDVVWHTFDSQNTAVNKAFTLPPNPFLGVPRNRDEETSEEVKELILWAKTEQMKQQQEQKKG